LSTGADELELASRFRSALETAAKTGDREPVYPFLAADVEWVTPKRTLRGIDEVREQLIWGQPREHLDLEFEAGDWVRVGEGAFACVVHQVYRLKGSGEVAYERNRRIELTFRDGRISRYEMRIVA
jgi:ketosteroid isomerase-like protein